MALFLIEHKHSAEMCPTKNPEMVKQLSQHVTDASAAKHGVKIVADFVYEPEHTLLLVLETDSAEKAMKFAQPFLQVGSLTIKAGATCEQLARQCLK